MKYSGIGGQAVLEGIMMKNKDNYATAVRKPDGEIVVKKDTYVSMTEKVKFFSLPFVRGIFNFADSMILGMRALTWSCSFFEDDEEEDDSIARRLDKQLLPLVRQQAFELQQLSTQLASLKDTLEERKLIEKAKSVLMTYQGMQEEQAWQALRKMAMDKNQRMVEIARALLTVKSLWQAPPKE